MKVIWWIIVFSVKTIILFWLSLLLGLLSFGILHTIWNDVPPQAFWGLWLSIVGLLLLFVISRRKRKEFTKRRLEQDYTQF